MKSLIKYLKPYRARLIIGPIFKLIEAILELMLPLLMSLIVDNGVLNGDLDYIYKMGVLMACTASVGVVSALICQYNASIVSQGYGTKLRNAMFDKITGFSNYEVDKFGTASLTNRITNDVNQLQVAVAMLIRLVIRAPFLCIGGFVMAILLDVKLSIVLMVVIPMFIIVLMVTMLRTIPLYKQVQGKLDKIAMIIRENLSGMRVIRVFSKMKKEEERFSNSNEEYTRTAVKVGKISALLGPLTTLIMNFAICAILWFGGVRVSNTQMDVGTVIAFTSYVTQILMALIIVSNLVVLYTKAFSSGTRVAEILNTKTSITQGEITEGGYKEKIVVEFKNVSMTYEGSKEYAIRDISFKVNKGETIGIIGGTGSGKSTLVNLIPRFYDASQGEVIVDGINVKEYKSKNLINKVGVVLQKSVLFSGTIKENLMWGNNKATKEEIIQAAKIAQADEFIEKMSEKYETIVSAGGVNFSGGQRQRLSIARALVKKPDILILDDSFNALDFATDARLRRALKENTGDMTTFIVTQRASTIRNANKILVLNDGELAAIGKHEELYDSCDLYKEICDSQSQLKGEAS